MNLCEAAQESRWDLLLLFGSRARDCARPDSDYDIAILAADGDRHIDHLCQALGTCNVDVAWLDESSWLLWQEVARDGVALYQRTPTLLPEFRLEALLRGWDADIWRRRNRRFVERVLEKGRNLNRDLIERKLALLSQYVEELGPILDLPRARFTKDPMVHHAAERLVELLVECAAAINTEVSQSVAGIPPSDYYSSFYSMAAAGWVEKEVADALGRWARLHNTLVHRYESVGLDDLYDELQKCTAPWLAYLRAIQKHLYQDEN